MRKVVLRWFGFLFVVTVLAVLGCKKEESPVTSSQTQTATQAAPTSTAAQGYDGQTATTTGVNVDIRLIGLCTVADKSVTPGETAAKTVILANHSAHMHKAMFLVPVDNIVDKSAFHYVGKENGTEYWGYDLTGIQLVLDYPNSNWGDTEPVRFSDAGDATNDRLPKLTGPNQNTTSLHWVPGMGHILGGPVTVKADYFKKEPPDSLVLARMALPGGELQSELYKPFWLWRFGNFKHFQVVANEIHYTFALKDPQQYYTMYGRATAPTGTPDTPKQLFQLKLDLNTDTTIPIYLANIIEKDFGTSVTLKPGYKDPHFELHYDLLDGNPPRFAPVIVTSMIKNTRGLPMGGGVYCGPDTMP